MMAGRDEGVTEAWKGEAGRGRNRRRILGDEVEGMKEQQGQARVLLRGFSWVV